MYEDITADTLHNELLDKIDNSYQKTVGYPVYDLTRAFALVLAPYYAALDTVARKLDVEQLKDTELTRFVEQRKGIIRKNATFAHGILQVTGNGEIKKGDLFESDGGIQFQAAENKKIEGAGTIDAQAVLPGYTGNVGAGAITMIPKTIPGITGCINPDPMAGGYETETDDSLRERYYEAIRQPPTSGNKYHYMMWAKEIAGVGDAKVFPLWQGDNTVLVLIINDKKLPADTELVARVQEHIDPDGKGKGEGQAPIGAYCTVQSAEKLPLTLSLKVLMADNYSIAEVKDHIYDTVSSYLKSIAFKQNYISYSKVINAINDAQGVDDFSDLTINGGISNVTIDDKQVAVLNGVNIDAI